MTTLVDLADELLSLILVDACAASSNDFKISISHVCRRLRHVALSIPQFWTHVSNDQSASELAAFLTRSREEKLTVELFAKRRGASRCAPFLKKVVDHAHRWKTFRFEADVFRRGYFFDLGRIPRDEKSQSVQLPSLETLHLHCYDPKDELDEELLRWGILYFWKAWEMPKLRDLSISIVTEDIAQDCSAFGTDLTSLRADYRSIHWEEEDLTNYADFLGKFGKLRNLELTFQDLENPGGGFRCTELDFPHLSALQVRFKQEASSIDNDTLEIFEDFMRSLRAPRLTFMALRVDSKLSKFEEDIISWLQRISYFEIISLKQLYVQFRTPSLRLLIQFPADDGCGIRKYKGKLPSLFGPRGKLLRGVPKLKLSGYPDDDSETNLGDYLFQDKNAVEFLKDYAWFKEDGSEGIQ